MNRHSSSMSPSSSPRCEASRWSGSRITRPTISSSCFPAPKPMHDDLTFRCSRRQVLHLLAVSALAASVPGIAHAGAYDDYFRAVKLDNVKLVSSLLQRGFDPNT